MCIFLVQFMLKSKTIIIRKENYISTIYALALHHYVVRASLSQENLSDDLRAYAKR